MSSEHDVTRRQFLNYTLMGVGGFMAATITLPMARMAIDPLLAEGSTAGFTNTGVKVDELTSKPKKVQFTIKDIQDAWYTFDKTKTAYMYKTEEGEVMAISPVCTHLGCTVHWSPKPPHIDEFQCPCHGSRFTKKGVAIAGLPATDPLHKYEVKIKKDGSILLGPTIKRSIPPIPEKEYGGA